MKTNTLGTLRLLHVGEILFSENTGNPYFTLRFKQGPFGKPVTRVMWGKLNDDDAIAWERIAPEEAQSLKGHNLAGHVEIIGVDIEPEEIVIPTTGGLVTVSSRSFVRFADETTEQAVRRSGSVPRTNRSQEASVLPLVGLNGLETA